MGYWDFDQSSQYDKGVERTIQAIISYDNIAQLLYHSVFAEVNTILNARTNTQVRHSSTDFLLFRTERSSKN